MRMWESMELDVDCGINIKRKLLYKMMGLVNVPQKWIHVADHKWVQLKC